MKDRMDHEKARDVLKSMLADDGDIFSDDMLYSLSAYLMVRSDDKRATLVGEFTADEIEAIAMWMRSPQSVANADVTEGSTS